MIFSDISENLKGRIELRRLKDIVCSELSCVLESKSNLTTQRLVDSVDNAFSQVCDPEFVARDRSLYILINLNTYSRIFFALTMSRAVVYLIPTFFAAVLWLNPSSTSLNSLVRCAEVAF